MHASRAGGRPGTARASRTGAALAAVALAGCAAAGLRLAASPPPDAVGSPARFGRGLVASDTAARTVTFELAAPAEVALVAVAEGGRVSALYPYAPGESSRFAAGSHTLSVPVSAEWVPEPGAHDAPQAALELERLRAYQRCLAVYRPRTVGHAEPGRASGDSTSRRGGAATPAAPAAEVPAADADACGPPPAAGGALGARGAFRVRNDVVVLVASAAALDADALRRRVAGLRVRSAAELRALPLRIAGEGAGAWAGYYRRRY